jgi:hypothetical protein
MESESIPGHARTVTQARTVLKCCTCAVTQANVGTVGLASLGTASSAGGLLIDFGKKAQLILF